jgi:hypothetical protein
MAKTAKDQRRSRRELLQQFEHRYDLAQLDYKKKVYPAQGKSKLIGITVACAIYGAVFAIAYFSWVSGRTEYELFMKTTWVLLLPATAAGMFSWMLAFNRLDNAVRMPIQKLIVEIEGERGMLWRYAPILAAAELNNTTAKTACNRSRERRVKDIDEEDYCGAVKAIHAALKADDDASLTAEILQEVATNLAAT